LPVPFTTAAYELSELPAPPAKFDEPAPRNDTGPFDEHPGGVTIARRTACRIRAARGANEAGCPTTVGTATWRTEGVLADRACCGAIEPYTPPQTPAETIKLVIRFKRT
jgi:hypothetical protein